ncbi:MAG: RNA polymerase sigma factor [Proteobacteria bacterium]|nr:RNA polymerase sigma factor [Pseudomonadota bacterium]
MQRARSAAATPITKDTADAVLARRAADGDAAAFEAIMRRYNRRLFRTARSILRSDADAEDALQDAWLHAWRALAGFRAEARLSTWLVRIVVNDALGRLRRRNAQPVSLDMAMNSSEFPPPASLADEPDQAPDRIAMRAQLRKLLEARIDQLPEAFRTVFMLRAIEEMSVDEIAQALDIPPATVRTRYFRARSQIRGSLASEIDASLGDAFAFDGARCDRMVAAVLARWSRQG